MQLKKESRKEFGKNRNWRRNEKGMMSAEYSQRSQCPHLGTSTTQQDTDREAEGEKGGRKRKKAGEKIKTKER